MALIALTIGVGVGLTAVFAYVAFSAHEGLAEIERSIAIDVYFDQTISNEQAQAIYEQRIAHAADVREARFITKEEALKEYEAGTGQDVRSVIGENPLPAGASLKIKEPSMQMLQQKTDELKAIDGVSEVLTDQELGKSLTERAAMLEQLTTWLGALMAIVILVVVAVATRLTVEIRKQSLTIMRLLGASTWKLHGPFILEGIFAGIIGGMIASLVLLALDGLALRTLLPSALSALPRDADLLATLALIVISAALGALGSALSLATTNKRV